MESEKSSLQKGIERRQQELHNLAESLAKEAATLTRIANSLKVATISLGAITAAKGTLDKVFGTNDQVALAVFSILGILIAIFAGVEVAFKFDKRGSELTLLASGCQAKVRKVDTVWRNEIGSKSGTDQSDAERRLISSADEMLAKVQEDAAKLGVNITLRIYELSGDEYRGRLAA